MPGQEAKKKKKRNQLIERYQKRFRKEPGSYRVLFRVKSSQLKSVKLLGKLRRWYQASKIGFCIKNDQIRMPSC